MPASAARRQPVPPKPAALGAVSHEVTRIPLDFPQRRNWWIFFACAVALLILYVISMVVLFWNGVGMWGENIPQNWALAISNYIWWLHVALYALMALAACGLIWPPAPAIPDKGGAA